MNDFFNWDPSKPNYTTYTITSSGISNYSYTINLNDGYVSIGPDLEAVYDKADKEFDAMEDQTSIAKQLLNDIGITWNED